MSTSRAFTSAQEMPAVAVSRSTLAYVEQRLQGTIWQGALGAWLYTRAIAFGSGLARLGVSANTLTYLSLALAALAGLLAALSAFGWAALAVASSGVCDVLDGVVARATHTSTRYGALLDSTIDRLADGLPLVGLVAAFSEQRWLAAIPSFALLTSLLVPYVRARAEGLGATLPPLFMRRAERVVALGVCLALAGLDSGALGARLLLVGVALIALLSLAAALAALQSARVSLLTLGNETDNPDVPDANGARTAKGKR